MVPPPARPAGRALIGQAAADGRRGARRAASGERHGGLWVGEARPHFRLGVRGLPAAVGGGAAVGSAVPRGPRSGELAAAGRARGDGSRGGPCAS